MSKMYTLSTTRYNMSMSKCVHTYTYLHIYIYIYIHVYMYTHVHVISNVHTCMHSRINIVFLSLWKIVAIDGS